MHDSCVIYASLLPSGQTFLSPPPFSRGLHTPRPSSITKSLLGPLGYKIKGRIFDSKKAIIKVYNYIINLENDYPNGFEEDFKNGDHVEFSVDRLDCVIENYY